MVRNAGPKVRYGLNQLHELTGSLLIIPRLEKIEKLEWLRKNISLFDEKLLKAHYGLFLALLKKAAPVKPLVDLLILLTDRSTVTQGRVNLVCQLYETKLNSPSLERLLRVMEQRCSPHVYVPPLGQRSSDNAAIPIDVSLVLASNANSSLPPEADNLQAAKLCTKIYQMLLQASPDIDLAEALAQLVPLVEQCGRTFGAIERVIYDYLEGPWQTKYKSQKTMVLSTLASHLFRFWPRDKPEILEDRLFKPLFTAQKGALEVLIPYLWHFRELAVPLMNHLALKQRPQGKEWFSSYYENQYMHIYQFYRGIITSGIFPPPVIVADLILRFRVYLFPCARWHSLVPAVCLTLQGEFCLFTEDTSLTLLDTLFTEDQNIQTLFAIANSVWVGGYPQRTFSRVKAHSKIAEGPLLSSKRPASSVTVVDPSTLRLQAGLSYSEFCQQLVDDLEGVGLDVMPYLQEVEE